MINKSEICFQSTSKVPLNINNKKKIITFVGKLNSAKGFDIFGKTILKILDIQMKAKYENEKKIYFLVIYLKLAIQKKVSFSFLFWLSELCS